MSTKELARGGLLTGMAVAVLYIGSFSDYISASSCVAAGLATAVPLIKGEHIKEAVLVYLASGLLGAVLVPRTGLVAGYILVGGLYPILKYLIESRISRKTQLWVKGIYSNIAIFIIYLLSLLGTGLRLKSLFWGVVVWAVLTAGFFVYDVALSRIIALVKRMLP